MTSLSLQTQNSTPFNTAIITAIPSMDSTAIRMTSQEIADLVQVRHDSVKRSIERLVESGVIHCPPMVDIKNHQNRDMQVYVFKGEQGKRDTMVLVAQLSPQFLGTVVDRWLELEKAVQQPRLPSNFKEALQFLIEAEEQKEQLALQVAQQQQVIEVIQPKADVYDIISNSENTYTIRVAAKLLKIRPKDLTDWLLANKWMYGRSAATYRPSAQHDRNHLKLVASVYGTQVRVTGKGLVWIARKLNIELTTAEVED
ncbi:phage antirepressor KilAC domain-containing protein [Acinetobacter baumannii]